MPNVRHPPPRSPSIVSGPGEPAETSRLSFFRSVAFQLVLVEGAILAIVLSFLRILTSEYPSARSIARLAVAVAVGIFGFGALIEAIAAIKRPKPLGHARTD